jgi:hypothetical protein
MAIGATVLPLLQYGYRIKIPPRFEEPPKDAKNLRLDKARPVEDWG